MTVFMQPKQLPNAVSLGYVDPHLQSREESMGSIMIGEESKIS